MLFLIVLLSPDWISHNRLKRFNEGKSTENETFSKPSILAASDLSCHSHQVAVRLKHVGTNIHKVDC